MLKKTIKITAENWNENNRYKVGQIAQYNNIVYQNLTGVNTEPSSTSTNWRINFDNPDSSGPAKILVNGNPFFLIKHPDNDLPENVNNLEDNDFISSGFWNATTYWPQAQCLDSTASNTITSWLPIGAVEELVIN